MNRTTTLTLLIIVAIIADIILYKQLVKQAWQSYHYCVAESAAVSHNINEFADIVKDCHKLINYQVR